MNSGKWFIEVALLRGKEGQRERWSGIEKNEGSTEHCVERVWGEYSKSEETDGMGQFFSTLPFREQAQGFSSYGSADHRMGREVSGIAAAQKFFFVVGKGHWLVLGIYFWLGVHPLTLISNSLPRVLLILSFYLSFYVIYLWFFNWSFKPGLGFFFPRFLFHLF